VRRVHAGWIVARVAHSLPRKKRAVSFFIRNAMREQRLAGHAEPAIPLAVLRACPRPALVRTAAVCVFHQAFEQGHSHMRIALREAVSDLQQSIFAIAASLRALRHSYSPQAMASSVSALA
jgi:hypothetical protein